MRNVLSEEQKQQVIALGRLGWSLRRIQRETGIRRETISAYLKEAGGALRLPRGPPDSSKTGQSEVIPDSGGGLAGETAEKPEPSASAANASYPVLRASQPKACLPSAYNASLLEPRRFSAQCSKPASC